jgi:hypothetical protein
MTSRGSYKCRFCCSWTTLLLILPLTLLITATVLLAGRFYSSSTLPLVVVVLVLGAVVLTVAWLCGTVATDCLVRSRLAGSAVFCSSDVALRSRADLEQYKQTLQSSFAAPAETVGLTKPFPRPVGRGWSFFLNRTSPPGKRLLLHQFRGETTKGSDRFLAGTTVGEALEVLKNRRRSRKDEGMTLKSTPSHDSITLGGWVGGGAHGSGGTEWSPTVAGGKLLDQATGIETEYNTYKEFKTMVQTSRDTIKSNQFVITEVFLSPTKNIWTRLQTRKHQSVQDCAWWLGADEAHTKSMLRCTFVGRRGSLMMLWVPIDKPTEDMKKHIDPHPCSRECRYFQADLLSVVQGARDQTQKWFAWPVEPQGVWDGLTRLENANRFSPLISALGMAIATFYSNVEVILRVSGFDAKALNFLQTCLVEFHIQHGGRTEVRFGVLLPDAPTNADRERGKLFLDVSLTNLGPALTSFGATVDKLARFLKATDLPVCFHPGKLQPDPKRFLSETTALQVVPESAI